MQAAMRRYEATHIVHAPPEAVFAHVDDPARLSSHMDKSSWMMAGGRMRIETDERDGKAVGSRIRLAGRVLGLDLAVDETVIERQPPFRKVWETVGEPKLLVIGHYRMGFEITPRGAKSLLLVFIEYALPASFPASRLGSVLGGWYSRWCVRRMISDAVRHFAAPTAQAGSNR